jgi:DNA helicase-2/ATP-dependent DNA helicase PcrA
MTDFILGGLNPQQHQAVTHVKGPVLVVAGPGSGKTRVLTHRIAYLIKACGVRPHQIFAVTFTNKAAGEMQERIEHMGIPTRGMGLGTFHRLCLQILYREVQYTGYQRNFTIYDTSDQRALLKRLHERHPKAARLELPRIIHAISRAKNELLTPDDYVVKDWQDSVIVDIYRQYMRALREANAMDFDDLLQQAVLLLENQPELRARYQGYYRYMMVDEFQDTNTAQYTFISLLAYGTEEENIFVVGDPDQSIYAFRGADYRNIQRFQSDFPKHQVIVLDENYRSHQRILDAAMAVIRRNPDHIKRQLVSPRKNGPQVELTQFSNSHDEANHIARHIRRLMHDENYTPRDFAIMYRTNAQSRLLEASLVSENLPYRILGGLRFYDRAEIKDLLSYLHVIHNPYDSQRLERIINKPTRGIGEKTQAQFIAWAAEVYGGHALEAFRALKDPATQHPFASKARTALLEFGALLERWHSMAHRGEANLLQLLDDILAQTDYQRRLSDSLKDLEESQNRAENIMELRRELAEYEGYSLAEYLSDSSLRTEADTKDPDYQTITLTTLHAAKGLEFPVVFLTGLEDGVLPHSRSQEDAQALAEERRLLYVGMTRAKDRLALSYAKMRFSWNGGVEYSEPSPFLADLPADIIRHGQDRQVAAPRPLPSRMTGRPNAADTIWTGSLPKNVIKLAAPPRSTRFKSGDVVYHAKFGQGLVMGCVLQDDIEEVEVRFEGLGIKRIDAAFLQKR